MLRHILVSSFMITLTVAAITISTQAAFTATATISGINFSTGHAALNLFGNLGYTNAGNNGNLTSTLPGPHFSNIGPNWTHDYHLKYFNNGSVDLMTNLSLLVLNDPAGMQNHISVETWLWNDTDGNGGHSAPDTYQLIASAKPLSELMVSPVELGLMEVHQAKGILLRFSTAELPGGTQNQEAHFNFVINGTTDGVGP